MGETEVTEYRDRLSAVLGSEWVERFDAVKTYLVFGPSYCGSVAGNWRRAVRMAAASREWEMEHWLSEMYRSISDADVVPHLPSGT